MAQIDDRAPDYLPSTDHVFEAYRAWRRQWTQDGNPTEEFERWIESEFRPQVVAAWDEGYSEGLRQAERGVQSAENPYRLDAVDEV